MNRIRVTIITPDLTGPIKNGGVGTAKASLAKLLAREGFDVTIALCARHLASDPEFHLWQEHYQQSGVRLISVPEPEIILEGQEPAQLSYACYLFLKGHAFDRAIFADMRGLGFYCQLAKRQGLSFQEQTISVILNGPDLWHKLESGEFVRTLRDAQFAHFERQSIELADSLVAPSKYVLNWAQSVGWKLPADSRVIQYPIPEWEGKCRAIPSTNKIREIVFFGRLEIRKGFATFCRAVELLPVDLLEGRKLTFLGGDGLVTGETSDAFLKARAKSWKFEWAHEGKLDRTGALEYLSKPGILAVIPSKAETLGYTVIECLLFGIPFVCSDIPAFRELVADSPVFFENTPEGLASKLVQTLLEGPVQASFRENPAANNKRWVEWVFHSSVLPSTTVPQTLPAVTVCIPHRDRPEFLRQALASLEKQTYSGPIEVIVVDDASATDAAHEFLDSLANQPRIGRLALSVLRNESRKGPSFSRNRAASQARGEYLLIMDDDNLAKPNEIERFVTAALHSGADILTCPFDRFYEDESKRQGGPSPESRWLVSGNDFATGFFINTFGDTNSFIRAETFRALGGFDDFGVPGDEDWAFFMRASLQGFNIESVPEALVLYREHGRNALRTMSPFLAEKLRLQTFASQLKTPAAFTFASVAMAGFLHDPTTAYGAHPVPEFPFLFNPGRSDRETAHLPSRSRTLIWKGSSISVLDLYEWSRTRGCSVRFFRLRNDLRIDLELADATRSRLTGIQILLKGNPIEFETDSVTDDRRMTLRIPQSVLSGFALQRDLEIFLILQDSLGVCAYSPFMKLEPSSLLVELTQSSVEFSDDGRRILLTRANGDVSAWTLVEASSDMSREGYLETAKLDPRGPTFGGWAADLESNQIPETILLLQDRRLVAEIEPNIPRQDVVEKTGSAALLLSGFHATLIAPHLAEDGVFSAIAVWKNGTAFNLSIHERCLGLRVSSGIVPAVKVSRSELKFLKNGSSIQVIRPSGESATWSIAKSLPENSREGFLDYLKIEASGPVLGGWAADLKNKRLPEAIFILQGDRLVAEIKPNIVREDVARSSGSDALLNCGFYQRLLPSQLVDERAFSAIAAWEDGIAVQLKVYDRPDASE